MPFDLLRKQAREAIGGGDPADPKVVAEDTNVLAVGILNCYMGSDLVELHGMPITFARQAGPMPAVLPLARLQATRGAVATNRRHEVVRLNDLDRHLVPLLDGTNDREALVEKLTQVAQTGALNVQKDGMTLYDPKDVRQALKSVIDPALANVARLALLVQ